ncbi:hypothetical protein RA2_01066 [Roseovarius sp. A-2]|uniref:hypothetical protein n=1 Tax=Roseovarius sp. A-2 TaxID=1570360 RepID=UPI0009B50626|nr:hypothetical protein [Roseovarius sp. A-2]GAW34021.1 hypothetical protein RA2_01066 [Roseovarius sp. A-2]
MTDGRAKAGSVLRGIGIAAVVIALLASCASREERVFFDGNFYPPKSGGERSDRRNFTATVKRVSRGVEGAQKAAVHEATRYCLKNFGTSDIAWAGVAEGEIGPVYLRSGDRITVEGRCEIW